MQTATGRCACGNVRYTVHGQLRSVSNCHCEPCRRITGHFMAATAAAVDAVAIEVEHEALRWYDSTDTVQYGFCSTCGSTLFWRASDKPGHLSITGGTLDQPTGLSTNLALFGDEAADYHELDRSIETVAGDRQLGVADD